MASIELGQPEGAQPDGAQPSIPDAVPVDARTAISVNSAQIPVKNPSADLALRFDWSEVLSEGVTLQGVEHTVPGALVRDDQDTNDDGATSDLFISGGVHGQLYQLTLVATLSNEDKVARTWPLRVFNS